MNLDRNPSSVFIELSLNREAFDMPNKGSTPTASTRRFHLTFYCMAENIPNVPTGAVPPKKETGKVQPKKETVRINLPPKPSAAPTIKLPTLPPGGPSAPGAAAPAPALS